MSNKVQAKRLVKAARLLLATGLADEIMNTRIPGLDAAADLIEKGFRFKEDLKKLYDIKTILIAIGRILSNCYNGDLNTNQYGIPEDFVTSAISQTDNLIKEIGTHATKKEGYFSINDTIGLQSYFAALYLGSYVHELAATVSKLIKDNKSALKELNKDIIDKHASIEKIAAVADVTPLWKGLVLLIPYQKDAKKKPFVELKKDSIDLDKKYLDAITEGIPDNVVHEYDVANKHKKAVLAFIHIIVLDMTLTKIETALSKVTPKAMTLLKNLVKEQYKQQAEDKK